MSDRIRTLISAVAVLAVFGLITLATWKHTGDVELQQRPEPRLSVPVPAALGPPAVEPEPVELEQPFQERLKELREKREQRILALLYVDGPDDEAYGRRVRAAAAHLTDYPFSGTDAEYQAAIEGRLSIGMPFGLFLVVTDGRHQQEQFTVTSHGTYALYRWRGKYVTLIDDKITSITSFPGIR